METVEATASRAQSQYKRRTAPIDNRQVLEGILWVLLTGARWQDLPDRPARPHVLEATASVGRPGRVAGRVAQNFIHAGCRWVAGLGRSLYRRKLYTGKKGGAFIGKTKKGKGTKWMVVVDGQGVPLGSILASASPAEIKLAEQTLDTVNVPRAGRGRPKKRPKRLIADKGYDSNLFRKRLKYLKIDMIVPHRRNRAKNKVQDGRKLRRYRKRWKVERTFA